MSDGNEINQGFVSAVMGFVIVILLPVFFQLFASVNAPWWTYLLLAGYVVITFGLDIVMGVSNSIWYTAGFVLGAYFLNDYLALTIVIIIALVVYFLHYKTSTKDSP